VMNYLRMDDSYKILNHSAAGFDSALKSHLHKKPIKRHNPQ
jgi:hypothetical protein